MNIIISAIKNEKGYVSLTLSVKDKKGNNIVDNVSIKVNDYGGTQKKRAKALTYKIYKALGE